MLFNHNNGKVSTVSLTVSIVFLLLFVGFKVWGYLQSGSLSLQVSAMDSMADIFGLIFTVVCFRIASIPLDSNHRYGHGKVNAIGVLASGIFIVVAGGVLFFHSIENILSGTHSTFSQVGVVVLGISALIDLLLAVVFYAVYVYTGTFIFKAQSLHHVGDLLSTLGLFLGSVLSLVFAQYWIEYIFALCIVIWLLFIGIKLMWGAVMQLTDHVLKDDVVQPILDIIKHHPQCYGIHDVRSRDGGTVYYLECHIELDGALSLKEAHDITEAIEEEIRIKFPAFVVFLHQEPKGIEDTRLFT